MEQVEAYRKELVGFKKSLEDCFNVSITEERMRDAISLHNETRRLQRKLYNLRKNPVPPVTGSETLAIMIAGTAMHRERYNALLTQMLDDCADAQGNTGHRVRVMLVGGEVDSISLVEAVESQGGLVVADSLGYGSRAIRKDVDKSGDPLVACARYQLMERPADPRIYGTSFQRNNDVKNIARVYNVDCVISFRLLQCDHWGLEQVNLKKYLKKNNIPHLALENEYILGSIGQIKTRVQAFFESIEGAGDSL
jgi:benzoyl-CoA reductase/2-hydroxyglutaryl-CoA dehydratase subunit BcrC/BadD/HgdB